MNDKMVVVGPAMPNLTMGIAVTDITKDVTVLLDIVAQTDWWYEQDLLDDEIESIRKVAEQLGLELPKTQQDYDAEWRMKLVDDPRQNPNYDEYDLRFIGPLRKPHDWDSYCDFEAKGLLPDNSVYEYDRRWREK